MSSAEDQSRSEDDEQHEDRPQKKAKFQSQNIRLRMTWKQKALAVQYYDETIPKPTYEQLAQWCKAKFKLHQSPHKSTVLTWLKADMKAKLLTKLQTEASPHVQNMKSMYECKHPQLESTLHTWFIDMQSKRAFITDVLVHEKALQISGKLGITDFVASPSWVSQFKKRHCIQEYICHGEAGSADGVNVILGQEICKKLFQDVSADSDIYNADETGLF